MAIWKRQPDIKQIAGLRKNTLIDLMGIEFTGFSDDSLTATMPVDIRTMQPLGIMHGGASCVLAETVGSIASAHCIDISEFICVGLDINTSHIRMVKSGTVEGTARPIHLGKTTHIWEIRIIDEEKRLISITRLTLAILPKRN